jgi:alpha-tubulin suppressor-like RCC1 family protein
MWGAKNNGRLGINDTGNGGVNNPVTTFAGGTDWKSVSCGNNYTAAIKTDGSLWTWGANGSGQLGTNDLTTRYTPVTTFTGGNNWKQSFGGAGTNTSAIKTDGSLWIWGRNANGQLGINNKDDRSIPVTTFAGGNTWKQVALGNQHTAAVKTDGTLWTWGRNNESGQGGNLGTNDTAERLTPVTTFVGGTTWKSVAAGNLFTSAIKTDGSLWTWGSGTDGKLGINAASTNRTTPVTTFAGGNNWKQVSCIDSHISATKTDGSLWVWGANGSGQLGDNTIITRSTPVTTFAGGNNWKQVSAGSQHKAAIQTIDYI